MTKNSEPKFPGERHFIDTALHEKFHHDGLPKYAKSIKVVVPEFGSGPLTVARVTYNEPVKQEIHAAINRDSLEVLEKYNDLVDDFLSGEEPPIGRDMADKILSGGELRQEEFDKFFYSFKAYLSEQGYHHADLSYVFANL